MTQSHQYGLRPPKERFNLLALSDKDTYLEDLIAVHLPDIDTEGVSQAIDR